MDQPISRFLWFNKQADKLYGSLLLTAAEQCGLTTPQAQVLCFLGNNPQMDTARDMAYLRNFSKAYISRALEPLLEKKLVVIRTDPTDRRLQHLKLTPHGRQIFELLHKTQTDFIGRLTQSLSPEETETLWALLDKISQQSLSLEES